MRKLLLAAILTAGLAFVGIDTPVAAGQQETGTIDSYFSGFKEIKLRVVEIKNSTLKLQDEKGKIHSLKVVDQRMMEKVQVGDTIRVKIEKREG